MSRLFVHSSGHSTETALFSKTIDRCHHCLKNAYDSEKGHSQSSVLFLWPAIKRLAKVAKYISATTYTIVHVYRHFLFLFFFFSFFFFFILVNSAIY